jgi:TPR repeat protein
MKNESKIKKSIYKNLFLFLLKNLLNPFFLEVSFCQTEGMSLFPFFLRHVRALRLPLAFTSLPQIPHSGVVLRSVPLYSSSSSTSSSSSIFSFPSSRSSYSASFSTSPSPPHPPFLSFSPALTNQGAEAIGLLNRGNFDASFSFAERRAEKDGDCAALMAISFHYGLGVKIDEKERDKWSERAREKGTALGKAVYHHFRGEHNLAFPLLSSLAQEGGLSFAQCILGTYYEDGKLEKGGRDLEVARRWYGEAYKQGFPLAGLLLGASLLSRVSPQDNEKGLEFLKSAALSGVPAASCKYAILLLKGVGGDGKKEEDEKKAVGLLNFGAEKGHASSQVALALLYKEGKIVERDLTKAFELLRLASERGNSTALHCVGVCYQNGEGVVKDKTEAIKYFRAAAEKGHSGAEVLLGLALSQGKGIERNEKEAVRYYEKAAEKGNGSGVFNLAVCYAIGSGVDKNPNTALSLFRKAADLGVPEARGVLMDHYRNVKTSETASVETDSS